MCATKCSLAPISSFFCTVNETHGFILLLRLFLALFIFFDGAYLGLWTSSLVYMKC